MTDPFPPFRATDPDVYKHFMGRWSARLAKPFREFAGIRPNDRFVGGGTGTLSLALAGGNSMGLVLDTGAVLHESISRLRDQIKARPIGWADGQANLWHKTGMIDVIEVPIVLSFDYTDFQDYWSSFSTGPPRIAQGLMALPPELRSEIEKHVRAGYLAGLPDGSRSFAVIVRAVRGIVPQ